MGAFYRTWIRLQQCLKKSATPVPSSQSFLFEPIQGIRCTRKLAIDALRDHRWLAAKAHLQDMDQHISELEAIGLGEWEVDS